MPDWSRDLRPRLASLRLSPTREAEIVEELSQHLDDRYREAIAGGATPEEAQRQALSDFQSGDLLARYLAPLRQSQAPADITIGAPRAGTSSDFLLDLRYAARTFWKRPAFAAATVLTLALGIGATTAIFSVLYGVVLKPLPFADQDRLVTIRHHAPHGAGRNHGPTTYLTYRENQKAFEAIGAWDNAEVSITGAAAPERLEALRVSSSALSILRLQPLAGRFFTADDDAPGGPLRVILTFGYWQRRFGGAADIVGRPLLVDGTPAEVIGVLPSSFKFLNQRPGVLLPMPLDPGAPRGMSFGFQLLARLNPGVTLEQGNADVARLISILPPDFARLELRPDVRPLAEEVTGSIARTLWILLAGVGAVLLIACANVANLFLVRAEGRHQELAMRTALGASRSRIASALLSESVVLALAGGALGVVLAVLATGVLEALAPADLPRADEIGVGAPVLAFAVVISIVSGLLFGLLAVVRFGNPSLANIKQAGRSGGDAPARQRIRNALVVGQVALALPLLVVSGLMMRTFVAMLQVDPGFTRPAEVQTFVVAIPEAHTKDPQRAARTFESIADSLSRVPGVSAVGLSSSITMDGEDNGNGIEIEEAPVPAGERMPLRRFKSFAPGYFETMGIPLVAGRSITWSEVHAVRPVIVISEPLAREYWGEPANALGKRIRGCCGPSRPWREIVGVTGNERDDGMNQPPTAIVYWPMLNERYRWRTMAYAVRSTRTGTPGFVRELEDAVWSVDRSLPVANAATVAEIQARSMTQTSLALVMLGIAAVVAVLISMVGIYGVVAYTANQRTREIGVRMALGAQAGDVRRMFFRQGLALTGAGIAIGLAAAVVLTRVISGFLFGVGPLDPATYAAVAAALAGVAMLAAYLPARRASRIDPLAALRLDA